jgi:AcrR family transcriptional regulator
MTEEVKKSGGWHQKRGDERRRKIQQAVLELLVEKSISELSQKEIQEYCQTPPSSFRHFYPDLNILYAELVAIFYADLRRYWRQNFPFRSVATWQDIGDMAIKTSVEFYRAHPAYVELMLSGNAPEKIKRRDRMDEFLQAFLRQAMKRLGVNVTPKIVDALHHAFQFTELIFSISVARDGTITDEAVVEAQRVARAYMSLYIPAYS